jgi:hypothetical protein
MAGSRPEPEHRLCIYCGSSPGVRPAYAEAARLLGRLMAEQNIGLVYGGGGVGLMGEVARAVLAGGGHVTGIIPEFLINRERMLSETHELVVTRTMHERKTAMFERATGFVAMPGGIGTLEELAEILTWAQLKQHARPVVLFNVDGFWDRLTDLLRHMGKEGFIHAANAVRLETASTAADVISIYHTRRGTTHDVAPVEMIKGKI